MKVSVIGGGYVGLVTGTCLASLGHTVSITEINPLKTNLINSGKSPIYEEGLEEILQKTIGMTLNATTSYDPVSSADIILICVGTPQDESGSANLTFIRQAAESIGEKLVNINNNCVVAVKSTVPPGTTASLLKPIVIANSLNNSNIHFAMNPEFLREGRAVYDFLHPDRIVIGADDNIGWNLFEELYLSLNVPKIRTNTTEAEMIKYTSNAFLATKISFSNEIGNICKRTGIDVYKVMEGVGYDARIGRAFLNAGAGFGGSCFPKDVMALIHFARDVGEEPEILKAVMQVNDRQPDRMIRLLQNRVGDLQGKRIAILGLAFKDNTDDIRESRAILIIQALLSDGADIVAYDPKAMEMMKTLFPEIEYAPDVSHALRDAEGALIMTEWEQFRNIKEFFTLMKNQVIIDGRHMVFGEGIEGVCW